MSQSVSPGGNVAGDVADEDQEIGGMLAEIERKRMAFIAKEAENRKIKEERLDTAKRHSAEVNRLKTELLLIEDEDAFNAVNTDLQATQQRINKRLAALAPEQVNVALSPELVNSPTFRRAEVALSFHALACSSVNLNPEEICFLNAGTLYPVIRAVLGIIPAQEPPSEEITDAGGVMTLLANRSLAILANINGFAIMLRKTMELSQQINDIAESHLGPDADIEQFSNLAVEYEQAIHELNIVCECAVRAILNKDGVVQLIVDIFEHIPRLINRYGPQLLRYTGNIAVGVLAVETIFPGALGPFKFLLEMGVDAVPLVANFAKKYPLYYAFLFSHIIVNWDNYLAVLAEHVTTAKDFALGLIPASLLNPDGPGRARLQAAAAAVAGAAHGGLQAAAADATGAAHGGLQAAAADATGAAQLFPSNSRVTLFRPNSLLSQIESGLFSLFNSVTDSFVRTYEQIKHPSLVQVVHSALGLARYIVSRLYVFRNEVCSTNRATPFDVKPKLLQLLEVKFKEGNFLLFTAEFGLIAHSLNFHCRVLAVSVVTTLDALDVLKGGGTAFRPQQEVKSDSLTTQVGSTSVSVAARHALLEVVGGFSELLGDVTDDRVVSALPNARPGPIPQDSMDSFYRWCRIAGLLAPGDAQVHALGKDKAVTSDSTYEEDAKSVQGILGDSSVPEYIKKSIREFNKYLDEQNKIKPPPPPPKSADLKVMPQLMPPERPLLELARMSWGAIQSAIWVLMKCASALKPECPVPRGGESVDPPAVRSVPDREEGKRHAEVVFSVEDEQEATRKRKEFHGGKSRTHRRRPATAKRSRRKAYNKKSNKRKSRKQLSRKKISRRRQSRRK